MLKKVFTIIMCILLSAATVGCAGLEPGPPDGPPDEPGNPVRHISVSGGNRFFVLGEAFSAGDISVTFYYKESARRIAEPTEYEIDASNYDKDTVGSKVITVKCKENAVTRTYTVMVGYADYEKSFKVLGVGNSFTQDSMEYLYKIADSAGAQNISLAMLVAGSASLALHRDYAERNIGYAYSTNTTGTWVANPSGRFLKDALTDEEWDVIVIQQVSQLAGDAETYNDDLRYLLDFINARKRNSDAQIVWNMTWAYQEDCTYVEFDRYDRDQMKMYNAIVSAVAQKILPNEGIARIIPAGTAIQNIRTGYIGDTLTRDGFHLTYNLGRYAAGMSWFSGITGWGIESLSYYPNTAEINGETVKLIKECVTNAIKTPLEITQSKYTA